VTSPPLTHHHNYSCLCCLYLLHLISFLYFLSSISLHILIFMNIPSNVCFLFISWILSYNIFFLLWSRHVSWRLFSLHVWTQFPLDRNQIWLCSKPVSSFPTINESAVIKRNQICILSRTLYCNLKFAENIIFLNKCFI
jgi:hypothetical protein